MSVFRPVRHQSHAALAAALPMLCLGLTPVAAQTETAAAPASVFDAYNNARPVYAERRRIGLFQNNVQRNALRGFQGNDRREDRRGGLRPFALPSDRARAALQRFGVTFSDPLGIDPSGASRLRAYSRYGGFGRLTGHQTAGDVSRAFSRRSDLITATSLNAPIYRALLDSGATVSLQSRVETTPFVEAQREAPPESAQPLVDWLRAGADRAHETLRNDAWEYFRSGAFQQAARMFDTAAVMDPNDGESRIGKILSYASLGAGHTAVAALRRALRHEPNIFAHDLIGGRAIAPNGASGNVKRMRALRSEARSGAGSGDVVADQRAVYVVVLWYLGERDEAMRAAAVLGQDARDEVYGTWPEQMRAAAAHPGSR